jgi:hypothetical protein
MFLRALRHKVVLTILVLLAAVIVVAVVTRARASEELISPHPQGARQHASPRASDGAIEDCSSRSEGAFGRPFRDLHNLVVGPIAFVGGADFASPSLVRSVGGQKYPVLVRSGHTVTVRVPKQARRFARLGYGSLPQGKVRVEDGHAEVTFHACPAEESAYSSGGTVGSFTFWSGFVLTDAPHCVPLDVYIDGAQNPRRIVIELGVRPCPDASA